MANKLPIYILIPTHNRLKLVKRTLKSVRNLKLPDNFRFVYILENGIPQVSNDLFKEDSVPSFIQYHYLKRGNKSATLNYALYTLIPEENALIIFLDDDVRFEENLIEAYVNAAGDETEGHYFGGPTGVDFENSVPDEVWHKHFPRSHRGWEWNNYEESPKYFDGYNWAAFKKDIIKLNGFDEKLGPEFHNATGEESRLQSMLMGNNAKPVYVKNAKVWHYIPEEQTTVKWLLKRSIKLGGTTAFNNDRNLKTRAYFHQQSKSILRVLVFYLLSIVFYTNKEKHAKYKVKTYRWLGRLKKAFNLKRVGKKSA